VWKALLDILDGALPTTCNSNARDGVIGSDMALCLAGLQPNGKIAPQWWLLIQRIAARWIWVRYADMKYGGNKMSSHEAVVQHVLKDVEFRLVTYWNEAHFSVVSKVELDSSKKGNKGSSLSEARDKFAQLWGPLATLKRNTIVNAGMKGREAMRLSEALERALKKGHSS
jgi:hypothetical protein